jgi:hypothetical protein
VRTGELAFGWFRLDRANALLWRGQDRVVLAPKPFELLCCLVERPGELVTKDELLDTVWSDLHVSESSLTVAMNALRSALGDDRLAPNYIETVRGADIGSLLPSMRFANPTSSILSRRKLPLRTIRPINADAGGSDGPFPCGFWKACCSKPWVDTVRSFSLPVRPG